MRCLFVAVAAQRLFQPSLRANPSYANTNMMPEVQAPYVVVQPMPKPGAADWIAANPITSCAAVAGLAYFATTRLSALGVIGRPAAPSPRADVEMSTKYDKSVYKAIGFKRGKTGDSSALLGYTVGSRAPTKAVNSGTVNKFGYGIGNLYGGGKKQKTPTLRGDVRKPGASPLGLFGILAFAAIVFYACAVNGGGIQPYNVQ